MVTDAEVKRPPAQHLTERFERVFVPCVFVLARLLLLAWVVIDEPLSASFY
jgi:Cd2+/Zn2+-exporting ATPase